MAARKLSRSVLIVIIVFMALAVGGLVARLAVTAASNQIQAFEVTDPALTKKVYIAMDNSEWKMAMVKQLVENFKAQANFKVENLQTLANVDIANWDAVIVVAPYRMAALQADAERFAKSHRNNPKLIMLVTTGGGKFSMEGVEAITAASDSSQEALNQAAADLKPLLAPTK